jgi:hypothetical protein
VGRDCGVLCVCGRYGQVAWEDQRRGRTYKGTAGGEAISFSGCEDAQTSADTAVSSAAAKRCQPYASKMGRIPIVEGTARHLELDRDGLSSRWPAQGAIIGSSLSAG